MARMTRLRHHDGFQQPAHSRDSSSLIVVVVTTTTTTHHPPPPPPPPPAPPPAPPQSALSSSSQRQQHQYQVLLHDRGDLHHRHCFMSVYLQRERERERQRETERERERHNIYTHIHIAYADFTFCNDGPVLFPSLPERESRTPSPSPDLQRKAPKYHI